MITALKVRYGWILVDPDGSPVEPLTWSLAVPFYRSEKNAQKKADRLNKQNQK